ncbi:TPA: hypothetical protein JV419_003473 [Escherichia coli]|nr:hypothetical protein [Escherichia coli]
MNNKIKRYPWYHEIVSPLWGWYCVIGIPLTLLLFWLQLEFLFSSYTIYMYTPAYRWGLLLACILTIPFIINIYGIHKRSKQLNNIVEYIKENTGFTLARGDADRRIVHHESVWVGIDNINGNMLFVKVFPKGVVDVIGLSPSNISAYSKEHDGNTGSITLHTNLAYYPLVKWSFVGKKDSFFEQITQFMNNHSGDNRFQSRIFSLREKLEDISGLIVPDISITTGSNMTHAEKIAQAHANAQKLKAWQAEMQRKEDEERARERQQQNANHSAPATDEPEYVELPRIPELSPEEQAALDKSMEKERAEMEKILGPIPTSFN